MRIAFRVDASLEIGHGHVTRCLTLAKALHRKGAECLFICRELPGNLLDLVRQAGFHTMGLPVKPAAIDGSRADQPATSYTEPFETDWERDAESTVKALEGKPLDWLVVDHYGLDARWESVLRLHCKRILAIDDRADRPHDCDLLLDQNLVADIDTRYKGLLPEACTSLLGPRYTLLQPEYGELQSRTPLRRPPVSRILVYFGGADRRNLTGMVIDAFHSLERQDLFLDVVINPEGPFADAIRSKAQRHPNIFVHERLSSLAYLMVKADMAVGASGATTWERCCLGLPSLVVILAENQRPIAERTDSLGLVRLLGDAETITSQIMAEAFRTTLEEEGLLDWSARCRSITDGRGVDRLVAIMSLNPDTVLTLRPARHDDADFLASSNPASSNLNGSHDLSAEMTPGLPDDVREMMRNPEDHRILVAETETGHRVGHVTISRTSNGWRVTPALAVKVRHVDINQSMIEAAILEFRTSQKGLIAFDGEMKGNVAWQGIKKASSPVPSVARKPLSISVCTDAGSWINDSVPRLLLEWMAKGHKVAWTHDAKTLGNGDLCFFLSYGRIVGREIRSRHANNLVVHASDLPKGRGWSPASWLILEGRNRIPVTLFECIEELDAGPVYDKIWMELDDTDLVEDWRRKLSEATSELVARFVDGYPTTLKEVTAQTGEPTFYGKRRPGDSRLDPDKTIAEQFDLLRITDNNQYPAFFLYRGAEYVIRISKRKPNES